MTLVKKILIPSIVIPVVIAVGIAVYFLNMPAWLVVERIERESGRSTIEIPKSILSDFPKLKEALDKADKRYNPNLPGTTLTMASFLEGYTMQETIRNHDVTSPEDNNRRSRLIIENEGKQYGFDIIIQYSAPSLA